MPERAIVLDAEGRTLSPCSVGKARRLVAQGRAERVREDPLTIRLTRAVALPEPTRPPAPPDHTGERLLLHICCGPCATFTVGHFRGLGYDVTGYWFGPNIHPYSEHERRREALEKLAAAIDLPVIWEPGYAMPAFLRLVADTPDRPARCRLCYRLRLAQTARAAAAGGFDAYSTTLLISPYQDLDAIGAIGEEEGAAHGVRFHYENLRSGFAAHHRLARAHGLYMQRYCGCLYSEWEGLRGKQGGAR
jgi:predicted adenine nucleotide alpha hydrolase (AANH) superfamily ATPase